MSVEESEEVDDSEASNGSSDEEARQTVVRPKKIMVHWPRWRSRQFNDILESLDRKSTRRQSKRSRSMVKKRERGVEEQEWAFQPGYVHNQTHSRMWTAQAVPKLEIQDGGSSGQKLKWPDQITPFWTLTAVNYLLELLLMYSITQTE